jgi:hypothetical protein
MHKANKNDIWGFKFTPGWHIEKGVDAGSKGYAYTIEGLLCKATDDCKEEYFFTTGDSLSFNVILADIEAAGFIDHGFALKDADQYIKSTNDKAANKLNWGKNTTKVPMGDFIPDVVDKDPKKPPFNVDKWFDGNAGNADGGSGVGNVGAGKFGNIDGAGNYPDIRKIWDPTANGGKGGMVDVVGKDDGTVHGFGAKGTPIPPSRAGELILTSYPNSGGSVNGMTYAEWLKDKESQRLFGIPPMVDGGEAFWGIADPSVQQPNGGYMFVKNGFPGESSVGTIKVSPTRCVRDKENYSKDESPHINCLNFSLDAWQPFKLAVTIYDHLGNFVTQYREEVSEQEFRSAVQAPTYLPGFETSTEENCKEPNIADFGKPDMAVANGAVRVNVNIYPFSAEGRRFGNGVYIVKVDRVDMPYAGCVNIRGGQTFMDKESFPFVRYHADMKYGWMRSGGSSDDKGSTTTSKKGRWF